ncbi:hypothetical protein QBC41DRAFT_321819 [Cercophora samala]|uniref:Secreted protein n=1 Tax=Cercophora samala TaxID=330535 RepID=A0AA39ZCX8_9PEZI|nr:hypothetical protein QBC41DRAFT_321819 [Cercophora samala]
MLRRLLFNLLSLLTNFASLSSQNKKKKKKQTATKQQPNRGQRCHIPSPSAFIPGSAPSRSPQPPPSHCAYKTYIHTYITDLSLSIRDTINGRTHPTSPP